jgi:hypothetical protein
MEEPIKIKVNGRTHFGLKSCPEWLKNKYRDAVHHTCQDCQGKETEVGKLEPHRIKRGVEGGLYMVVPFGHFLCNVKMLCKKCHDKYDYSKRLPSFTTK